MHERYYVIDCGDRKRDANGQSYENVSINVSMKIGLITGLTHDMMAPILSACNKTRLSGY